MSYPTFTAIKRLNLDLNSNLPDLKFDGLSLSNKDKGNFLCKSNILYTYVKVIYYKVICG